MNSKKGCSHYGQLLQTGSQGPHICTPCGAPHANRKYPPPCVITQTSFSVQYTTVVYVYIQGGGGKGSTLYRDSRIFQQSSEKIKIADKRSYSGLKLGRSQARTNTPPAKRCLNYAWFKHKTTVRPTSGSTNRKTLNFILT